MKMRTPTGVAYRYKNRCNRICLCCQDTGVWCFPTVLAHAASRQPWYGGPAAVRLLPVEGPPRSTSFFADPARALTPAEASATFS